MKISFDEETLEVLVESESEPQPPYGYKAGVMSASVESILLYKILEKLEEIRTGVIDVEDAIKPRHEFQDFY